jgi:hypothetical protein
MQHRFRKPSRTFLLPVFLGLILVALAVPVHAAGDEETVARNFLKFLRSDKTILSSEVLQGNLLDPALPLVTVGHLFHLQGGGYLLISSDRSISPVKAYSLTGDFSGLPESYRKALLSELELRFRVALEAAGRMPLDAGTTETGARWDFLLGFEAGRIPLAYTDGTALLQTRWNQGYPYNKFLPQVGGETVVAGCVNIALAQVMRYHRHPAASQGVVSYLWDGPPSQTLKAILYRNYNWGNMPATADSTTPEYQTDEVALLIRDLGIANRTNFGINSSGTSLNSQTLLENFGYSTSLDSMSNTVYPAFLAKIQSEIAAERPVLLTFPGHMTVADGYQTNQAGVSVHVNMGWGGTANDFYFLDQTVSAGHYAWPPSAGSLQIHYNIKPCSAGAGDCAGNLEAGDGIAGFVVTGNFNYEKDTDRYGVYLKGATTLAANRGYSNVAFYGSIFNAADGSEVFTMDDDSPSGVPVAAGALVAGKYLLRASLCNVAGSRCYTDWPASNAYTVSLTSGTPTAEEKALIDQALEKAPIIGSVVPESPLPDLFLDTAAGTRKIRIDARDENGDVVTLGVQNSDPAAVGAALNGNILELTPTGVAKVSSRIAVTAAANGKTTTKEFIVLTDSQETGFGSSFSAAGVFTGQSDVKIHRAVLDGACSIHGDNGFTTQGFYSSVRNADGSPRIAAGNTTISGSFPRGVYLLTVSLQQNPGGYGSYYPYAPGNGDRYSLAISCPDADMSTPTIAGLLGIDLAGANLPFDKPGDVNNDDFVTLADAVIVLQMLSGMDTTGKTMILQADANGDQRIGLIEAIFILQRVAGLRSP